ncbi:hypothetical protein LPUS_10209 [Lasallia pustulata]|uniref:Uncharacterized protein n=1 Tax=Lasallia pustulata TaxID=136370 RepID=A0A1W5D931_9LECA|nr:hypothetical protein LPUS_10209 [Lasallia pustulata]
MPVPLQKSSTQAQDGQASGIARLREASIRSPKFRPVPLNNELNKERRDQRVTPISNSGDHETVGNGKPSAGRRSLLPQRRDVKSKASGMEVVDRGSGMATDQAIAIKEDNGSRITAKFISSVAISPTNSTSYSGEASEKAPTTAKSSSAAIPKAMGPPKALGRSQSVRKPEVVRRSARRISQTQRTHVSVITNSQTSTPTAHASYRRNPSLIKSGTQPSLRSVLGQASAAANHHRRSVANVSGGETVAIQSTGCGPVSTLKDVKQKPAIGGPQRASSASSASVLSKNLHMRKDEDRHSKPQGRISSAPTAQSAKPRRPEFTTLQQHFTPKKSSMPPTASFSVRSPYKQPEVDNLSLATTILQTELLQIHVLHRSSYTVQSQWERSAERVFRQRLEKLVGRYEGIRTKEDDAQDHVNLLALISWCQDYSILQLAEKAQVLSQIIQDVQSMTDFGGKYTRVVGVFEQWFACSSRLLHSREERKMSPEQGLEFVEDLGDGWKAELAVSERKLASMAREFSRLGPAREGSSLAFILKSLGEMISSMQDEVASMRIIETQIITQEQVWVAGLIDKLTSAISSDLISSEASLRKGVWQEVG